MKDLFKDKTEVEQFPDRYYKVIDCTYEKVYTERRKQMLGKIYKAEEVDYEDNTIKLNGEWFNFSDVQLVTPVKFEGEYVCVGDTVNGNEVAHGYYWNDCKYLLNLIRDKNYITGSYIRSEQYIKSHTPLFKSKTKELTMNEIAEKFGIPVGELKIKK